MLDPAARNHLGVPVRFAVATRPAPLGTLSAGERAQWDDLVSEARRRDWLLGRAALKALPTAGADTSGLAFPHARLSLTHAGGTAFAVCADTELVNGAGIDFEPSGRHVDPRASHFFLRREEAAAVAGDAAGLLRLWTVKEALFKATPDNSGAVFVDYCLGDATARLGTAHGSEGDTFRYASVTMRAGVLTVAVCLPKVSRDVAV